MNESQYNRVAPHYEGMRFFMEQGANILGSDAIRELEAVSQSLGRMPTDMSCGACKSNLIKMMYNIVNEYRDGRH